MRTIEEELKEGDQITVLVTSVDVGGPIGNQIIELVKIVTLNGSRNGMSFQHMFENFKIFDMEHQFFEAKHAKLIKTHPLWRSERQFHDQVPC